MAAQKWICLLLVASLLLLTVEVKQTNGLRKGPIAQPEPRPVGKITNLLSSISRKKRHVESQLADEEGPWRFGGLKGGKGRWRQKRDALLDDSSSTSDEVP